jgi:hypothetical protein
LAVQLSYAREAVTRGYEAEESPLFEVVARKQLVKTAGRKRLSG